MTETEVVAKLRNRYAPPTWAFIPQVRNGTGFQRLPRTADALAMALWPSRGLELIGFEIKTSRSDWLAELKNAEKAESIFAFCDRWYLVGAGPIIQPGELPAGWGYIAVGDKGCKIEAEAERRKGKDVDRLFLAAILRRQMEATVPKSEIEAELIKAREDGKQQAADKVKWNAEETQRLREHVAAFEKASGLSISDGWRYTGQEVGRAVKDVLEHGTEHMRQQILAHKGMLERMLKDVTAHLEEHP
jgi:hypothetical protein